LSGLEEWRPVVGYEGIYEVSSLGRVRKIAATRQNPAGFEPSQHRNSEGYVKVGLHSGGQYRLVSVHRLVALAFHGTGPGLEACHRDGDQTNNAALNLYWGTKRQNQLDTVRHGNHREASKTECAHGHPYTSENTLVVHGKRKCRTCHRERQARYRAAKRDEQL